jgi:hypothetical protein
MPTSAGITMMKMIESLPEPRQELAQEHLRENRYYVPGLSRQVNMIK